MRCQSWEDREGWIEAIARVGAEYGALVASSPVMKSGRKNGGKGGRRPGEDGVGSPNALYMSSSPMRTGRRGGRGCGYLEAESEESEGGDNKLREEVERTKRMFEAAEETLRRTREERAKAGAALRFSLLFLKIANRETASQIKSAFGRFGDLSEFSVVNSAVFGSVRPGDVMTSASGKLAACLRFESASDAHKAAEAAEVFSQFGGPHFRPILATDEEVRNTYHYVYIL